MPEVPKHFDVAVLGTTPVTVTSEHMEAYVQLTNRNTGRIVQAVGAHYTDTASAVAAAIENALQSMPEDEKEDDVDRMIRNTVPND